MIDCLSARRSRLSGSNATTSNPCCTPFARKRVLRSPTRRQIRTLELSPVELMALLEWELRNCPRAPAFARCRYQNFSMELRSRLERGQRSFGKGRTCQAA